MTEPHYVPDCIALNCAEWYKREDFIKWLNEPCTATWHRSGEEPHEQSDCYVHYDHGEGPDMPVEGSHWPMLPADIWQALSAKVGPHFSGVIWIRNLE